MSAPQIPEAAKKAAHDTYCSEPDCDHRYDEVLDNILAAALPHIERTVIQRLIEKAEAQVQAILNANHGRTPVGVGSDGMAYTQAVIAKGWLRAELEEGGGE